MDSEPQPGVSGSADHGDGECFLRLPARHRQCRYPEPGVVTWLMVAIGMFSGYCGTLTTPMAANFTIVPAALLALPDKNAVIKAQVPTGVLLLLVNVFLLYFLIFL